MYYSASIGKMAGLTLCGIWALLIPGYGGMHSIPIITSIAEGSNFLSRQKRANASLSTNKAHYT